MPSIFDLALTGLIVQSLGPVDWYASAGHIYVVTWDSTRKKVLSIK